MRTAARALGKLLVTPHRPIPPSQPSCSRWLTCSCCRSATYFSPNNAHASTRTTILTLPPPTPEIEEETGEPSNPISKAHFLPLPPRLPYSPTSHPFRRHLEILSLSTLSDSPDESWRIYLSLHPSLRRYIPDSQFRSLLSHQLSNDQPRARWIRSKELIEFGQKCGLEIETLGIRIVLDAWKAGLAYMGDTEMEGEPRKMLDHLWASLFILKKGNMSNINIKTRRIWLEYHLSNVEGWRKGRKPNNFDWSSYSHMRPLEVVLESARCGIGKGTEDLLGRLLVLSTSKADAAGLKEAAEAGIYCWSRRIDIPDQAVEDLMANLARIRKRELQGLERGDLLPVVGDRVDKVISSALIRIGPPSQRAIHFLAQPATPIPDLIRVGLKILLEPEPDYTVVLEICHRLLYIRNSNAEALYHAFASHLHAKAYLPHPPEEAIVQSARTLSTASTNPVFLSQTFLSLLPLTSPRAYDAARRTYAPARTAGFEWTFTHANFAHRLILRAVRPDVKQIHFASRIYTDLIADHQRVTRRTILALVQAVTTTKNASRPILLERYIRDFVDFYPDDISLLVKCLVAGLSSTMVADDALLAWTLVKRLGYETKSVSAASLFRSLALSTRSQPRRTMLEIISAQSEQSDTLPELYEILLTSIVQRAQKNPTTTDAISHEDALALTGSIFREMTDRGIPPTAKTATALIRGLVEVNELDRACAMLKLVGKNGIRVKSSVIGRLMMRFAIEERYTDADEVESVWRASVGEHVYDKGVIGARSFIDLKLGKEVTLGKVGKKMVWKGNKPFSTYLKSLEDKIKEEHVEEEMEEVAALEEVKDVANEVASESGEREGIDEFGEHWRPQSVSSKRESSGQSERSAYAISGVQYVAV